MISYRKLFNNANLSEHEFPSQKVVYLSVGLLQIVFTKSEEVYLKFTFYIYTIVSVKCSNLWILNV